MTFGWFLRLWGVVILVGGLISPIGLPLVLFVGLLLLADALWQLSKELG